MGKKIKKQKLDKEFLKHIFLREEAKGLSILESSSGYGDCFPGTLESPNLLKGDLPPGVSLYYPLAERILEEAREIIIKQKGELNTEDYNSLLIDAIQGYKNFICLKFAILLPDRNPYLTTSYPDFLLLQHALLSNKQTITKRLARFQWSVFALAKLAQFVVLQEQIEYNSCSLPDNPRWYSIANDLSEKPEFLGGFDLSFGQDDENTPPNPMLLTPQGFGYVEPLSEAGEAIAEIHKINNEVSKAIKSRLEEKLKQATLYIETHEKLADEAKAQRIEKANRMQQAGYEKNFAPAKNHALEIYERFRATNQADPRTKAIDHIIINWGDVVTFPFKDQVAATNTIKKWLVEAENENPELKKRTPA